MLGTFDRKMILLETFTDCSKQLNYTQLV